LASANNKKKRYKRVGNAHHTAPGGGEGGDLMGTAPSPSEETFREKRRQRKTIFDKWDLKKGDKGKKKGIKSGKTTVQR